MFKLSLLNYKIKKNKKLNKTVVKTPIISYLKNVRFYKKYNTFNMDKSLNSLNIINLVYNQDSWSCFQKNSIYPNLKSWIIKFQLLVTTYAELKTAGKFRYNFIKTIFNVIFFENTIGLKKLFFLWIQLMPLKKHKKLIISLFQSMVTVEFFNYLFYVRFKLLFQLKGKLGIRGDGKKKKQIKAFRPEHRHIIQTGLNYDGVGSASKFGLTFFTIKYAQTNFKSMKNDDAWVV